MISEKMMQLGKKSSIIREIFEYCKTRGAQIGSDKVFDFSIGNPSVEPPVEIKEAIIKEPISFDTPVAQDLSLEDYIADNIENSPNQRIEHIDFKKDVASYINRAVKVCYYYKLA